jgi:hypothetical protein
LEVAFVKKASKPSKSDVSKRIATYITSFSDWRGPMLARIRKVVLQAVPEISEEWKWGTPVWTHNGLVCAASAFKNHVKVNFFRGASLRDPKGLFNAGLEAKTMRSIDFHQGDKVDSPGLASLVRAAVALNTQSKKAD